VRGHFIIMAKAVLPVLDGSFERLARDGITGHVAGIDEAGRGPLAGPVVTAAVILDLGHIPAGLADSKLLTPQQRVALYDKIMASALCVSIASASPEEIDRLNIRETTHLAMRRCAAGLALPPTLILVDGHETAGLDAMRQGWAARAIIKGDMKVASIAAASIIAKVTRDRMMERLDAAFPGYGFARHNGYGTSIHVDAIHKLGPTRHHRFSFSPMKERWQEADFRS
jgi:ribonuclease HII